MDTLIVPLFFLVISVASTYKIPENNLLFKVLDGVERGAKFFAQDYSDLNVDGLYGLRIAEGQIIESVRTCKDTECNEELINRLYTLLEIISSTAEKAMPYIRQRDSDYFERFRSVVDKPYLLDYQARTFETTDDARVGTDTQYDEGFGDKCYARLMGSSPENNRQKESKCLVTDECYDYMTKDNTGRYFITHQLLYFILAEHLGCAGVFKKYETKTEPRSVVNRLCKNIYKESTNLVDDEEVFDMDQDLFLEQTVLCSTLGFEDFQRLDWMKMVLKWQRNDGCFASNLPKLLLLEETNTNRRKLLREANMSDGCLSHKSGLGFGVLSSYLRYLVNLSYSPSQ